MEDVVAGKLVAKARERVVDMLGLSTDIFAAVIVVVRRGNLMIQDGVVVALIEDQDAVVAQRGIEFCQGLAAIVLVVQMGE